MHSGMLMNGGIKRSNPWGFYGIDKWSCLRRGRQRPSDRFNWTSMLARTAKSVNNWKSCWNELRQKPYFGCNIDRSHDDGFWTCEWPYVNFFQLISSLAWLNGAENLWVARLFVEQFHATISEANSQWACAIVDVERKMSKSIRMNIEQKMIRRFEDIPWFKI